jgi:site-specific recombinase XerC
MEHFSNSLRTELVLKRCWECSAFTGLRHPAELRTIIRAHVIARRKHLESRELAPSSIRRKLSALSALFDYLCERNAVAGNSVDGVKRPMSNNNKWLANIINPKTRRAYKVSTTRLYDRRKTRPEDSPTFRVRY